MSNITDLKLKKDYYPQDMLDDEASEAWKEIGKNMAEVIDKKIEEILNAHYLHD